MKVHRGENTMSYLSGTKRACYSCSQDKQGLKAMFFPKGLGLEHFYGDNKNHLVCEKCRTELTVYIATAKMPQVVTTVDELITETETLPYEQKIGPSTPENLGSLFTKRW